MEVFGLPTVGRSDQSRVYQGDKKKKSVDVTHR